MTDYMLVVVTHGESEPLAAALQAFNDHVTPAPKFIYAHRDAPTNTLTVPKVCDEGWIEVAQPAVGFCEATRRAWRYAAAAPFDYVFWLEHDFVVTRDVDLEELAAELDRNANTLAQMALMRDPVNQEEIGAGGLYELRRDEYKARLSEDGEPWLRHTSYFTTNPSLMRRSFMEGNPWPAYPGQCEGRFGIDLVGLGWSFGVWGDGQPWCRHAGVRDGSGFGY